HGAGVLDLDRTGEAEAAAGADGRDRGQDGEIVRKVKAPAFRDVGADEPVPQGAAGRKGFAHGGRVVGEELHHVVDLGAVVHHRVPGDVLGLPGVLEPPDVAELVEGDLLEGIGRAAGQPLDVV